MNSTQAKRGRKAKDHRQSWDGKSVDGLYRKPGGDVWRVRVTGQEFTEPDERLAIARFHRLVAEHSAKQKINLPVGTANVHDIAPLLAKARKQRIRVRIPRDHTKGVTVETGFDTDEVWAWLRTQILTRPQYVALRTGIEQIGWLTDMNRPTDSPALVEVVEVYASKPGLSDDEVARCRRYWTEFTKLSAVKTLRDVTHEVVERYEQKVTAKGLAPKSVKHRFTGIRTIVAYAMKRGKWVDDCRKALDRLAMLQVQTTNNLDPNPIRPTDFWAIHAEAVKADDHTFAALLLFSLNCALYSSEVGAVKWTDVDLKRGEFVTRRRKTGVPRVGVLWPATIKALKALPRERDTIFNTSRQGYNRQSIFRTWTYYRTEAGIADGVTFAMIRDASFTAACRVSLDQARVLAGHRLPGAVDHYVLRQPQFVAPACEAIRKEFDAKPAK